MNRFSFRRNTRWLKKTEVAPTLEQVREEILKKPKPYVRRLWIRLGVMAAVYLIIFLLLGGMKGQISDYETFSRWVLGILSVFISLQCLRTVCKTQKTFKK